MRTARTLCAAPFALIGVVLYFLAVVALVIADAISCEKWSRNLFDW